jgi:hypothetical protein
MNDSVLQPLLIVPHDETMKTPLNLTESKQVIEAWLKYHEQLEQSGDLAGVSCVADEHLWAIHLLDDISSMYPEHGWKIFIELLNSAHSDYQLACLASGILESLLANHGPVLIEQVEKMASDNIKFRETLSAVWKNSIADDIWIRISRAASL